MSISNDLGGVSPVSIQRHDRRVVFVDEMSSVSPLPDKAVNQMIHDGKNALADIRLVFTEPARIPKRRDR